jgi:long-chain acyl-CoA synthetase
MLQMAQRCRHAGGLEQFIYIGTSSVSGKREGPIYEHELEMGQEFFNSYEQSKYETERLLNRHMGEIPIIILRPSIVVGDSTSGRTTLFNAVYLPLRLIHRGLLSFVPGAPDTLIDLVPVDWVVDATLIIMRGDLSVGQTFHLTAGPKRATRFGQFLSHAIDYLDANSPLAKPRRLEILDPDEYQDRLGKLSPRMAALYAQIGLILEYATVDRLYDSTNADAVVLHCGLQFPYYDSYADNILRFALLADWGKKKV